MGWKACCTSLLCECLHAFWFQAGNVLWCVWPGQTQEVLNLLKLKNKPKMFGTSQNTHVVSEGEGLDSFLIWCEHHTSGKHKQCRVSLQKGYTLAFGLMTVSQTSPCPGPRGISRSLPSSFDSDSFLLGCHRNLCLWTIFRQFDVNILNQGWEYLALGSINLWRLPFFWLCIWMNLACSGPWSSPQSNLLLVKSRTTHG